MIVAAKLLIVVVWIGAGVLEVRPPLHQRGPADGLQHAVAAVEGIKRTHYRNFPEDLRPSQGRPVGWRTSAARSSSS